MRKHVASVVVAGLVQVAVIWSPVGPPPVALAGGIATIEIPAQANSRSFGEHVLVLSNGNYVIADPQAGAGFQGAVTLYDGVTNGVISTLVGAAFGHRVGAGGLFEVGSSNFVVLSPNTPGEGSITWVNGTSGLNGTVNPTNSITGYAAGLHPEFTSIVNLTDGDYVIANSLWWNGSAQDAGFARWAPGNAPASGPINSTTSAVGGRVGDRIGSSGVVPLANGNYVVGSPEYDWPIFSSALTNSGAATFGNGSTGTTGVVSELNSLIGLTSGDSVGFSVVALSNGNYVVASPNWYDGSFAGAGAATWASGTTGITGAIDATNSLVGHSLGENVGAVLTGLTNGNYVVGARNWDNGSTADVGAVTWASGATGTTGFVTGANSMIGGSTGDLAALELTPLTNGHYVLGSPLWGPTDVGAATWINGSGPTSGVITAANSITGSAPNDRVGGFTQPLVNGNYVVASAEWRNGAVQYAGAVTWAAGSGPTSLVVSAANSIVGSHMSDLVGAVTALDNGNYVVSAPTWDNGAVVDAGAVRWAAGSGPSSGPLSGENSLVGSSTNDTVGSTITRLEGDRFSVSSPHWSNGALAEVGAVTSVRAAGRVGPLSPQNSLVGLAAFDRLGDLSPVVFPGGVTATFVGSFGPTDVGAVAISAARSTGPLSSQNSVVRSTVAASSASPSMRIGTKLTGSGAVLIGRRGESSATLVYPPVADYQPLAPSRLADTRAGHSTVDGLFQAEGIRPAGSTYEITVAGRGGVPASAAAVALNVTATEASGDGFVTVYPCGSSQPTASNLNVATGATVPNAVIAKVGIDRTVCFFVQTEMHLVVDVDGYFPARTAYHALNPARLLDTRPGYATVDGIGAGAGIVAGGTSVSAQVTGRGGVPVDATTVVLNVTATQPAGDGYVTVYPCGSDVPLASNLNVTAGATVPNLVIAKVGVAGNVCVYTLTATHLVIDVNGYFQNDAGYQSLVPARLLETRPGLATADGQQQGGGPVAAGAVTHVHVLGRGGVAADATTVVLNVTVTEPSASGYVTVYPCGIDPPLASNLNYTGGATIANAVLAKVGEGGDVCLISQHPTHLVVDVAGYSFS